MRFRPTSVMFLAALAALAACSSGGGTEPPRVAARLDVVSGANQQGFLGQPLPAQLVVRATDAGGRPVSGASVQWTATGGTVSAASTLTDANGLAGITWTLGSLPVASASATVAAVATPAAFPATGRPLTIHSCETNTATLCTDWTYSNGKYSATWSQGSHAEIVISTLTNTAAVFVRDDPNGTSAGMHAVYSGTPGTNGVIQQGVVTWTPPTSFSFSGVWSAQW